MKNLTLNQKLRITRMGQGLSLEKAAKKVFLSISHISLMENDKRKVPNFVEKVLNLDEGIQWYQTIIAALSKDNFSDKEAKKAFNALNKILKISVYDIYIKEDMPIEIEKQRLKNPILYQKFNHIL